MIAPLMTYEELDNLIRKAQECGGHQTKSAAVNAALHYYVNHYREGCGTGFGSVGNLLDIPGEERRADDRQRGRDQH